MDHYTILVCVLGVTFGVVLASVIFLVIYIHRKHLQWKPSNHEKYSETKPFAKSLKKLSIGQNNRQRLSEFLSSQTEEDEVFEEEASLSDIVFSLYHIPTDERLVVDVWSVKNTPTDFARGYLEVQLFPSDFDAGQFRTNERECVENAVIFNESFIIPDVSPEVLNRVHLKLFLYDCHGSTEPQCVGHAVFFLGNVQLNPLGKTQFEKKLIQHKKHGSPSGTDEEPRSTSTTPSPQRGKGELYISLRYQKKSGRINVVVLKAENIQKSLFLQSDPYVKIKLLYQGEVADKRQTKTKRRSSSTCWNEPFAFNIDEEKGLENYELVFLVRRRDLISPNATIGFVRIGPQVGGAGQSHWYAMMAKGNLMRQVARCHRIQ